MSTINCLYCKNQTTECPECKEPIEQHLTLPAVMLIISLLLTATTGYYWYSAIEDHEKAMNIRQTYLKKNPEALKKLH